MKIVEPFVKKVEFNTPCKKIEYAGRICYKSQDKITDTSYEKFVASIANRGHTSVLEAESITLRISRSVYIYGNGDKLFNNDFFFITRITTDDSFYVTANIRAFKNLLESENVVSNFMYKDIYALISKKYPVLFGTNDFVSSPTIEIVENPTMKALTRVMDENEAKKHVTFTFHIRTDRATSHQIVRHRLSSFSQESQRYCNFSIDKFDNEVKFILPRDVVNMEEEMEEVKGIKEALTASEKAYFSLLEQGLKPETARCVLPNATATEIIMTSNLVQWDRFFNLRCDSHAQIDIREIACEIRKQIYEG